MLSSKSKQKSNVAFVSTCTVLNSVSGDSRCHPGRIAPLPHAVSVTVSRPNFTRWPTRAINPRVSGAKGFRTNVQVEVRANPSLGKDDDYRFFGIILELNHVNKDTKIRKNGRNRVIVLGEHNHLRASTKSRFLTSASCQVRYLNSNKLPNQLLQQRQVVNCQVRYLNSSELPNQVPQQRQVVN